MPIHILSSFNHHGKIWIGHLNQYEDPKIYVLFLWCKIAHFCLLVILWSYRCCLGDGTDLSSGGWALDLQEGKWCGYFLPIRVAADFQPKGFHFGWKIRLSEKFNTGRGLGYLGRNTEHLACARHIFKLISFLDRKTSKEKSDKKSERIVDIMSGAFLLKDTLYMVPWWTFNLFWLNLR